MGALVERERQLSFLCWFSQAVCSAGVQLDKALCADLAVDHPDDAGQPGMVASERACSIEKVGAGDGDGASRRRKICQYLVGGQETFEPLKARSQIK